ncbi:MAG: ATP phosphoribosyltransferase [Hyphomicrobiales bacterium]
MSALTLAIPSKGRLKEATEALFTKAGLAIERQGSDRLYRASLKGIAGVEVALLSAAEIAAALRDGKADLGVTGEDLLNETMPPDDGRTTTLARLGFGPADVVVAVPAAWLDVATMADLDDVSVGFYARHGRRLRVATKYPNLTRRFFAEKGVTGYRTVESLGATEGAPAAGIAEAIVDITTTGATLTANALKILDDGVILKSQAALVARSAIARDERVLDLARRISAAV